MNCNEQKPLQGKSCMTRKQQLGAVIEALSLGLSFSAKARNGDNVRVSTIGAKCSKTKGIIYEYSMQHTFGEFSSPVAAHVAEWALNQAGIKMAKEAQKQTRTFILSNSNRIS